MQKTNEIIPQLLDVSARAAREILEVYQSDFSVDRKEDQSPLTIADTRSHALITAFLKERFPYPVLSEEGKSIPYGERKQWEFYWLVDPLDGTKEFVKRLGDFTVNIALIHHGRPVAGVIAVPVAGTFYYAERGRGAFRIENGKTEKLPLTGKASRLTVVGSRSHATGELEEYIRKMKQKYGELEFASRGSSLKFCLVAEGKAQVYPRLGPTMEWDTAAGQIIVEEAGGKVLIFGSDLPLRYNKEDLLNPSFIAFRGEDYA